MNEWNKTKSRINGKSEQAPTSVHGPTSEKCCILVDTPTMTSCVFPGDLEDSRWLNRLEKTGRNTKIEKKPSVWNLCVWEVHLVQPADSRVPPRLNLLLQPRPQPQTTTRLHVASVPAARRWTAWPTPRILPYIRKPDLQNSLPIKDLTYPSPPVTGSGGSPLILQTQPGRSFPWSVSCRTTIRTRAPCPACRGTDAGGSGSAPGSPGTSGWGWRVQLCSFYLWSVFVCVSLEAGVSSKLHCVHIVNKNNKMF